MSEYSYYVGNTYVSSRYYTKLFTYTFLFCIRTLGGRYFVVFILQMKKLKVKLI